MATEDIFFIIGSILFLIAGFYLISLVLFFSANQKVNSWTKCKGKIINSDLSKKVERYSDIDYDGASDVTTYKVNIDYEYTHKGKVFRSNNLYASKLYKYFLLSYQNKKLSENFIEGQEVTIYVNPLEPKEVTLMKKINLIYTTVLFVIFLSAGLYILLRINSYHFKNGKIVAIEA